MTELAKFIGICALAGLVIASVTRVVEWVVPSPETRVIVCFASDTGKIDVCKTAAELLKK